MNKHVETIELIAEGFMGVAFSPSAPDEFFIVRAWLIERLSAARAEGLRLAELKAPPCPRCSCTQPGHDETKSVT